MLQYNKNNDNLSKCVEELPRQKDMLPLYLDILKNTDNHIIRGEMAYLISQMAPDDEYFKALLIQLINSPNTERARGSLLYALQFLDYSDDASVDMLCDQLMNGNWECRQKAFYMLGQLIPKMNVESKAKLEKSLTEHGEILAERLDMVEELIDTIAE